MTNTKLLKQLDRLDVYTHRPFCGRKFARQNNWHSNRCSVHPAIPYNTFTAAPPAQTQTNRRPEEALPKVLYESPP